MLQIIADDLGLHQSINEGIIYLFEKGYINGASLMVNGEAFNDAVENLKKFPAANIGIHLVLVEEKPLVLEKLAKNYKTFFIKYILGLIKLEAIEKELRAQLNKCVRIGIKPTFINSHQHLHLLPAITNIVIKLAKEFSIPYIRIVREPISLDSDKLFRQAQLLFLNFLSWRAKNKIIKAGLKCNDFFVGFLNAGNLSKSDIDLAFKLKNNYPNKTIELGCHPGFENHALIKKYGHWKYNWQGEINNLSESKDENTIS